MGGTTLAYADQQAINAHAAQDRARSGTPSPQGGDSDIPAHRSRAMPSVGWRLVSALIALTAVMAILVALLPGDRESDETRGDVHRFVLKPWAACVREVRHQFSGEDVEVAGPRETAWDGSGTAVEVVGTARPRDQRDRRFACRVTLMGNVWTVERVVFEQ